MNKSKLTVISTLIVILLISTIFPANVSAWDMEFPIDPIIFNDLDETMDTLPEDYPDAIDEDRDAEKVMANLDRMLDIAEWLANKGAYDGAISKLDQMKSKMDGSIGGNPNNDWIVDPDAQALLIEKIDKIIESLENAA